MALHPPTDYWLETNGACLPVGWVGGTSLWEVVASALQFWTNMMAWLGPSGSLYFVSLCVMLMRCVLLKGVCVSYTEGDVHRGCIPVLPRVSVIYMWLICDSATASAVSPIVSSHPKYWQQAEFEAGCWIHWLSGLVLSYLFLPHPRTPTPQTFLVSSCCYIPSSFFYAVMPSSSFPGIPLF